MFACFDFARFTQKIFAARDLRRTLMGGSAVALVFGAMAGEAPAEVWTNDSGTEEWGLANNWTGGAFPDGAAAIAVLPSALAAGVGGVNLNGLNITLNALEIRDNYVLTGNGPANTLTFATAGLAPLITHESAVGAVISDTIGVVLDADTTVDSVLGDIRFDAVIAGVGGLSVSGAGRVVLAAVNTYSGGTTVNAGGTLVLSGMAAGAPGFLGPGQVTLNGGTLEAGDDLAGASSFIVAQAVGVIGAATITSGGDDVFSLTGPLSLAADSVLTVGSVAAGTLGLNFASVVADATATVVVGTGRVAVGNATMASDLFTGVASTTIDMAGILDLNGFDTTVSNLLGNGTVTNTGAGLAELVFDGSDSTVFSGLIADGSHAVALTVTKTDAADVFELTAANSFSGVTTVTNGVLSLSGAGSLASTDVRITGGSFSTDGGALFGTTNVTNTSGSFVIGGAETVGSLNGAGPNTLNGVLSLTNGVSVISGLITGTGGLRIDGGAVVLAGSLANTNSGGTTVINGTLTVSRGDQLGSGPLVLGSASGAAFVGDGTFAQGGVMSVTGTDTVVAATDGSIFTLSPSALTFGAGSGLTIGTAGQSGTVLLSPGAVATVGANVALNVAVGTLGLGNGNAAAALTTMDVTVDGTLDLRGEGVTVATLSGSGQVVNSGAAAAVTIAGSGAATLSGSVSGAGGLTLNGAGLVQTLSGTNTYSGATTLTAGTLVAQGGSAIDNASVVTFAGGSLVLGASETVGAISGNGTIDLGANTLTVGGGTFSGTIAGTGGNLAKTGAGTTTLTGANTFTGGTTVSGGTLVLSGGGQLGAVGVDAGAFFDVMAGGAAGVVTNAGTSTNQAGTVGSVINAAGSFTNSGLVSGTVLVSGGTLNNTVSINGLTTVEVMGGFTNSGAAGDIVSAGSVAITGSGTANAVTSTGVGATSAGVVQSLAVNGGDFSNSGTVALTTTVAGGTLTNSGILTGTVTQTDGMVNLAGGTVGTVIKSDGLLEVTAGSVAAITNTGGALNVTGGSVASVTNAGTATNTVTIGALVNSGGTMQHSGCVSGTTSVTGGVVTNSGGLVGMTTVNGGTLNTSATVGALSIVSGVANVTGGVVGAVNQTGGTANNAGTVASLIATGATAVFNNAGAVTGTTQVGNGAIVNAIGGSFGDDVTILNTGIFRVASDTEIAGDLTNGGRVEGAGGAAVTLTLTGGNTTFTNTGVLSGTTQALTVQATDIILAASSVVELGVTLIGNVTNQGAMTLGNELLGDLTVLAGATVTLTGPVAGNGHAISNSGTLQTVAGAVVSGVGSLNNSGSASGFALGASSSVVVTEVAGSSGAFVNNGVTVIGDSASLTATTIYNQTGSITMSVNASLTGTGNTLNNAALLAVGDGSVVQDAGAINNAGPGTIQFLAGGTLNADTDDSGDALNNAGLILSDDGGTNTIVLGNGVADTFNNLSGGTLNIGTTDTFSGVATTLNNAGTVTLGAGSTLSVLNFANTTGTVNNAGTITAAIGSITNAAGGTLDNLGTGTITNDLSTAGTVMNAGSIVGTVEATAGTVDNSGSIAGQTTIALGATVTNTGAGSLGAVVNAGTLDIVSGTAGAVSNSNLVANAGIVASVVNTAGTFTNTGIVSGTTSVTGGTVDNSGSITGQTTIALGATVTNSGAGSLGAVVNAGTLDIVSGTAGAVSNSNLVTNAGTVASLVNTAGTFTNTGIVSGTTSVTGGMVANSGTLQGAVTNTATLTSTGVIGSDLTNTGAGVATLSGTLGGDLVNAGAGSVTVVGNLSGLDSITQSSTADVTLAAGTVTVDAGGTVQNSSGFVIQTGAVLAGSGGTAFDNGTGGVLTVDLNGTLNMAVANALGGTVTVAGSLNGVLTNAGTALISGTQIGDTVNNGTLTMAGAQTGTLTNGNSVTVSGILTGDLVNTGTADVVAAGTVTGNVTNTGGTATIAGAVGGDVANANGAAVVLDGTVAGNVGNDGTMTLAGDIGGGLTNFNAGALTVTGLSTVTGAIANAGNMSVLGGLTFGSFVNTASGGPVPSDEGSGNIGDARLFVGAGGILSGGILTNNTSMGLGNGGRVTSALVNNGVLLVDGTAQAGGNLTNNAGAVIDLMDGDGKDVLQVSGNAVLNGNIYMDVNFSGAANGSIAANEADRIDIAGSVSGAPTLTFANIGGREGTLGAGINILTYGGVSTLTPTLVGLPNSGAVLYEVINNTGAGALQLQSGANPAIGGLASGLALTQSLIGSVVNRPSSPFVTGLAGGADVDPCGYGTWGRVTGGKADAEGKTTTALGVFNNTLTADYAGVQVGADYSCFGGFYNGWDMSFGGIFGLNRGSTGQPIFYFDPTTGKLDKTLQTSSNYTDFDQIYGGAYIGASRAFDESGRVLFADLQLRADTTTFDLRNSPNAAVLADVQARRDPALPPLTVNGLRLGVTDQTYKSRGQTISGSMGYSIPINEAKDLRIVPTLGFSFARISTDSLKFDDGVLEIDDTDSRIGFAGVTLSKTQVLPSGTAALNYFGTATLYNDFAGPTASRYYQFDNMGNKSGLPLISESSKLGAYGELSLGMNYTKLLDAGMAVPARQLDVSLRVDGRYRQEFSSWGVTAQMRLQF